MVEVLVYSHGGTKEKRGPIFRLGFMDGEEQGNVMTAFDEHDSPLFDFAFRPYAIGENYVTSDGLFLC